MDRYRAAVADSDTSYRANELDMSGEPMPCWRSPEWHQQAETLLSLASEGWRLLPPEGWRIERTEGTVRLVPDIDIDPEHPFGRDDPDDLDLPFGL